MTRSTVLAVICLLVVAFGCDGGGSSTGTGDAATGALDPADYATDCSASSECVAVYFGNDACCGGCVTHAIASKDKPRYDADYAAFHATCASAAPCPPISCPMTEAICTAGVCSLATCNPTCPSKLDGG